MTCKCVDIHGALKSTNSLNDDQQFWTDEQQLCAALPCVALQHPVRICNILSGSCLERRYWFRNKPTRQHVSPRRGQKKMQDWQPSPWLWYVDSALVRSGLIYPDMVIIVITRRRWHIVSVSSSKVSTFSIVFVSSSKFCGNWSSSCKEETYPERFLSG